MQVLQELSKVKSSLEKELEWRKIAEKEMMITDLRISHMKKSLTEAIEENQNLKSENADLKNKLKFIEEKAKEKKSDKMMG